MAACPAGAWGEQASQPGFPAADGLDAGAFHTCALASDAKLRCWGFSGDGQLGYGNTQTIGDDETPASVVPVDLGPGRTVTAISAGDFHTCVLVDDGGVRCWGFGAEGRLGLGNTNNVGDSPTATLRPVKLGVGHTAVAISAGGAHTCAVLDDGSVRCWGSGGSGQLGYGNTTNVGDTATTTPDMVGPVKLGTGHKAKAISAGDRHTCALLDDDTVRCWGYNNRGQLGYGNTTNRGDTATTTPDMAGPVKLGGANTAKAISAGTAHTCAVLGGRGDSGGDVRCWGYGGNGELGYASPNNVGDDRTPDQAGPVNLGPRRTALAISAGGADTCARLDDGNVRCWGYNGNGQLGYANTNNIGDDELPGSMGPVNLGSGRTALAIAAGRSHTCARLDDGHLRCWGYAGNGRLGYCNQDDIGDDEPPGVAGPVNLAPGDGGVACKSSSSGGSPSPTAGANKTPTLGRDAARARGLRRCLVAVASHAHHERSLARRAPLRRRARAKRHISRHAASGRRRCLRVYGRTPGRISTLRAHAIGKTRIQLDFKAPGTDGNHPPAAASYLIKQAIRPIRSAHDFARARTLCQGHCRFSVTAVGARVSLTVTDLEPHSTYYYAVAARDNVSARRGARSHSVKARTG